MMDSTILATCPTPLLVLDPQGRIKRLNPALLALAGVAAKALQGRSAAQLEDSLAALLALQGEGEWTTPDGRALFLRVHGSGLADGGEVRWIEDRSETRRLQTELRAQSLTDEATGLLNPRGVMLALEPQVARSRRYQSPMAIIMMEACAEQASAQVQQSVSRLLKDQLRWADIIGYSGQGEFILVLPETSRDDALKLADKLSAHLQELPATPADTPQPCYGVTEWRKSDSAATLLQRATTALQQAREAQQGMAVAL